MATFEEVVINLDYLQYNDRSNRVQKSLRNRISISQNIHKVCKFVPVITWFGGQVRINFLSKILKLFCNWPSL